VLRAGVARFIDIGGIDDLFKLSFHKKPRRYQI